MGVGQQSTMRSGVTGAVFTLVIVVFAVVYLGMALGRWPGLQLDRTGVAVVGAIVLYAAGTVDAAAVRQAVHVPTLLMLAGLMVLSAQFAASGFYDWCAARLCAARLSPAGLIALVTLVAGGLSAVLANDVVVYAMTPMLCRGMSARGLDPRPFLIALACGANAGSAATIIGNPQNIMIGQFGGLDFWRFLVVCGPPALASLLIAILVIWLTWRRRLAGHGAAPDAFEARERVDRSMFAKGAIATAALLALFATTLPQVVSVLVIAGTLLVSRRLATRRMLGMVDWHLLVLFAGLFVVTGALSATGVPARALAALQSAGVPIDRLWPIAALSLAGSNTIGNVPLVVLALSSVAQPSAAMLYALALLSTLAGNLFIVGSLANIIVAERAAQSGVRLGFADHARSGVPVTLASFALSLAWLAFAVPTLG